MERNYESGTYCNLYRSYQVSWLVDCIFMGWNSKLPFPFVALKKQFLKYFLISNAARISIWILSFLSHRFLNYYFACVNFSRKKISSLLSVNTSRISEVVWLAYTVTKMSQLLFCSVLNSVQVSLKTKYRRQFSIVWLRLTEQNGRRNQEFRIHFRKTHSWGRTQRSESDTFW